MLETNKKRYFDFQTKARIFMQKNLGYINLNDAYSF